VGIKKYIVQRSIRFEGDNIGIYIT